MLERQGFPQAMHNAFRGVAFDAINLTQGDVLLDQILTNQTCTINEGMRHGAASVRLECDGGPNPRLAKIFQHGVKIAIGGIGKTMEQTMVAFKHSGGAFEAGLRHAHRAVGRLRCPSGVHALGPRTIGQILNDAARHAAGNAKSIDQLFFCQIECSACLLYTSDAADE